MGFQSQQVLKIIMRLEPLQCHLVKVQINLNWLITWSRKTNRKTITLLIKPLSPNRIRSLINWILETIYHKRILMGLDTNNRVSSTNTSQSWVYRIVRNVVNHQNKPKLWPIFKLTRIMNQRSIKKSKSDHFHLRSIECQIKNLIRV